jgi:signal transduction histidine kinase
MSPGATAPQRLSWLLLAGVAMAAVVVVAGAYFSGRAITREVAAARLQSDFVATVSHEFRTPLTTLRQLTEMLARGRVSGDRRRQEFYDTLVAETARLNRLVEGLLQFGRAQAGAAGESPEAVDVAELVESVVSEFRREHPEAAQRVTMSIDGAGTVVGDRVALARALWNLIDNAVKYSSTPAPVVVETAAGDEQVAIAVRDRGIGIPEEELPLVFNRFTRGQAARDQRLPGTGIGLTFVRDVAETHGGSVSADSSTGRGSTFTLTLPIERPSTSGSGGKS